MCCKVQFPVGLWQRMSDHCAPFQWWTLTHTGKIHCPGCNYVDLPWEWTHITSLLSMRLCTVGTELCDSADPNYLQMMSKSRMYLTSWMSSFCILSSNRNVACSISLNGILSQCVSCELMLHWHCRSLWLICQKGGDLCFQLVGCGNVVGNRS